MSFQPIGDLAQFMTTRRHGAELQSRMSRLTEELSTGQTADVTRRVDANFGRLSDIQHRITLNAAQKTAGTEASARASVMQTALERVQTQLSDISSAALMATGSGDHSFDAGIARGGLDSIVSALNTSLADRPLFAGTDIDGPPLVDSADLMQAARTAVIGAGDAASVVAALDSFFDTPGGGFETAVYKGGDQDLAPVRLGAGESVRLSLRADDPVLRSALKHGVMAALAADDSIALASGDRATLLETAGGALRADIDGVTRLRSGLGTTEARIDRARARISAEGTSLAMMRNEIVSVDRFETATALEQTQMQLETIYTLTARTSRLNLVNFL